MDRLRLVVAVMMCCVATGAVAATDWMPVQCGREPAPPPVDTTTVARYNASVDRVTLYEHAARSYNACVARAANLQQTAISNDARMRIDAIQTVSGGLQRRIAATFTSLSAQLRSNPPRAR